MRRRQALGVLAGLSVSWRCTTPQLPTPALRIGLPGTIPGLDPHAASDFVSVSALANAYEGLVSLASPRRTGAGRRRAAPLTGLLLAS